jgi:heme A synthase
VDKDHDHNPQVISYLQLRRLIGMLGILFPLLLAVLCALLGTCRGIEDSLSAYYHTDVRDLFVGILFTIGWFLYAYEGYEPIDNRAGNLAGVFCLGVALFPTHSEHPPIRVLHFVCAVGLFLTLAYFSLFLFTKGGTKPTPEKLVRNRIYRICGGIMLGCIALISLYFWLGTDTGVAKAKPVFWLESIALWAFGLSWLTKGEFLCADRETTGG